MKGFLLVLCLTQPILSFSFTPSISLPFTNNNNQIPLSPEPPNQETNQEAKEYPNHTLPSWFTSTLLARRLLAKSPTGSIATIYPETITPNPRHHWNPPADVAGLPIPLPEYIASCDGSGNPTILALHLGTTFKNIAAGSNVSLSIDWWDHLDAVNRESGREDTSLASLPRAVLFGYLDPYPDPLDGGVREGLEGCFLGVHPDARAWVPGSQGAAHEGFWARLVVQRVFWVGGFGDRARIGWVNMTEWRGIKEGESEVGDGRGWGSVRLPGESA